MAPSRVSKNTCTACRSAKIRCDRAEPSCDRCTKLGIICIEQVRTQGRPRKPPGPPMPVDNTASEAATLTCDSGSLLPSLQLQGGESTAHGSSDVNASGPFPELPTTSTSTITVKPPRRLRPADYPVSSLATDLSHSFANLHGRGQTCKEKTIAVLRAWGLVSGTHRQDSSHGAFNQIVRALALDHTTAIRVQQRPPATRDVPSGTPLYGPVVLPSSSDSSSSSVLHASLHDLNVTDGGKAVAFYIIEGSHVQLSINPLFHSTHMTFPQALALLNHHKMLPIFLWGSLFTPASQHKFYSRLGQAIFNAASPVGEITMDLECVGRQGEEFWGRTTVRHMVEGEGAYVSCIISIEPLSGDEARLPLSPVMVAHSTVNNKKKRSMPSATAWKGGRQQQGGAAAGLCSVKKEEEESVREGDDEKEWDDEGTAGDDASSSSGSSGSSGSGGAVDDLGRWGGPLTRRQQKRKCLLLGGRHSSSTSGSSSSSSNDGDSPIEIGDEEEEGRWRGAYMVGSEEPVLVSLPPFTSGEVCDFQQQQMEAWQLQQLLQQQQQQYQAPATDCGGETSDEEAEDEEQVAWDYPRGQPQDQPWQLQQQLQRGQSVGDFQSTLLSLAALPPQAPCLIGSTSSTPTALKQHVVAMKIEHVDEDDEEDCGAGDFDDLMRCGFDWGMITPSSLTRLAAPGAASSSHIVPPPPLPLTRMTTMVTTTPATGFNAKASQQESSSSSPSSSAASFITCVPMNAHYYGGEGGGWFTTAK